MGAWFGRVNERHFRQVCKNLIEAGQLDGKVTGIKDTTILQFR